MSFYNIPFQSKQPDRKRKTPPIANLKSLRAQSNHSYAHAVIGDAGYQFRKLFDTGWFCGTVTEIRLGADGGKDRRVVYSDGNVEDLSVDDLTRLSMVDPELKKM